MADKRVYLSGALKRKRKEEKKEKEELANKTSQNFNLFHLGFTKNKILMTLSMISFQQNVKKLTSKGMNI